MPNIIKLKRGLEANRTGVTPAQGELLYTTDTKKIYVGDGVTAGGVAVTPDFVVQYPQNIRSANYTLALSDAGKQIFHPASDLAVRTYTIPANSSVAFPIGSVVLFSVENGGFPVDVRITSDTLVFGDGTTGAIRVNPNQTLMALKVTATKWMANYLYQTGAPQAPREVVFASQETTAPNLIAYPYTSSGFGTKYTDPATGNGNGRWIAVHPNGNAIVAGGAAGFDAYPWNPATGFGTRYASGYPSAGLVSALAFSPSGAAIAYSGATIKLGASAWSTATGFGAAYSAPGTALPGVETAQALAFSPAGNAIAAVQFTQTPRLNAYAWNDVTGFGSKYSDPGTIPPTNCLNVTFSPAGDAVAVVHSTTPWVSVYAWNAATGFGTKFANPATLPTVNGTTRGVAFSPSGDAIAISGTTSGSGGMLNAYAWSSSGFGSTLYTATETNAMGRVKFNAAGTSVIVGSTASCVGAFPWQSGVGFGTRITNPVGFPAALALDVQISN